MGDDRPFVCNAPGCGQRFTNEDHLAVHKHKHEMTLKFGPARTDSVIIADQTPTPTRFLKNCEEVGLFNELASSFEHEFKKAAEDDEKKARGEGRHRCPKTEPCSISGLGGWSWSDGRHMAQHGLGFNMLAHAGLYFFNSGDFGWQACNPRPG
ncbi:cyclic AMP-dependent transcription factor ATF-7 isoform X2 [Cygnus olor]|uniref:cyclic AMP-dependent transcription factor ATF-7 isoform X2 n=1 Tax=Cygnus olor TaxID=8869 RepID=UPI001ADE74CB|nr:cyclic AMP-dependent transcription factor ATF-7 isoform X2 [Cygnus olor]XP_040395332.1 cyclic AMP-dependent transcription factor ATF-7 isoform X2 [Cygnus olor]XP_040395333.1 cyclic AMP-dependent transcription factor ATF-7 isoform X2 [Cygnus olor]XP_040395334.1 cyclic AMP-dependent transcription factor ATF-7 isoform X2 [Cygnus olor]XP_040395335.1 cyclic AMP-dependent transcription factor ATF-7 isoform X2 [Cygnus olor]XP_040395336.1 cyclic AMP-dependent transcription factor ATF-7 isoform X2 [